MSYLYASTGKKWQALGAACCIVGALLLLSIDTSYSAIFRSPQAQPVLGPCTGYESGDLFGEKANVSDLFRLRSEREIEDPNTVHVWSSLYHDAVEEAIEQHLGHKPRTKSKWLAPTRGLVGGSSNSKASELAPKCDAEDVEKFLPAPPAITSIAGKLTGVPAESSMDTGIVLLEFLRAYECALVERFIFLPIEAKKELEEFGSQIRGMQKTTIPDVGKQMVQEMRQIQEEMSIARRTLNRTLTFIGSIDRLRPLSAELECLQRASLDIRNGMALAADTSACLPRIWNAKDPLRDLEDPEE